MVELDTYLGALKLEVPRILEESREAWADVDGGAWEAAERERTSAATDALCAAARTVFDGTMRVADLEDAWRATYEEYLGVTPADAREGVLQDVHWASGYVGYFPSYVLGDMYTAQIFDALLADVPDALARLGGATPRACAGGSASTCGATARPTPRRRPCASRRAPTRTWTTTSPTCAGASVGA